MAEELSRQQRRVEAAVSQHRERLRARRTALLESGIELPPEPELDPRDGAAHGRTAEAELRELTEIDARLRPVEAVWQRLEQQFEEIAVVRAIAAQFGWSIVGIPSRVDGLRATLTTGRVRVEVVEQASREARDELSELAEALEGPARAELLRRREVHEATLEDPVAAHRGRTLAARAERHLEAHRLADALRDLVEYGGPPTAPRVEGPDEAHPPSSAGPVEAPPVSVASLREKARGLAQSIHALPAESDAARQAASEIREATDLLRQGRLAEADSILTRLKRSLGTPSPVEGGT